MSKKSVPEQNKDAAPAEKAKQRLKYSDSESKEIKTRIMQRVSSDDYKPVKPKLLAKQLKVSSDYTVHFRRLVKQLIKAGKLNWGPSHMVQLAKQQEQHKKKAGKKQQSSPQQKPDKKQKDSPQETNSSDSDKKVDAIGRFRRARQGFGFVVVDKAKYPEIEKDIHVPFRYTLDATDQDIVAIRFVHSKKSSEKGPVGRIVKIIKRSKYKFVGTYSVEGTKGYVSVDSRVFDKPIAVGDASAKDCHPDDKVVIEMVNFPSENVLGEAVVVEVLGARGKPGVDTLTIMREFDLPNEFPEKVIEEARMQAESFNEESLEGRTDYTSETVITIDPKTARDFDDAISLTRLENGHWMLGVHIADVSHFVQPNTHLDREAYARGTSVYLPDRVVPMIPETISNNLASLQPDRVRYVVTTWIEMTEDGARVHTEVKKGAIKSCRRFTYEEIDDFLEDRDGWKSKVTPQVHTLLENMHDLAMQLRKRRDENGSIELVIPDVKIDLNRDGEVIGAHNEEYTDSHKVIEEFMLSANEAVAEKLNDLELPYLRRTHDSPDPKKLRMMTEFIQELGIECESLESRFEIKRVLAEVADRPEKKAVNFSILRSMKKAKYSPQEIGHYALASENYCHFTSPIRRYPDLVIHRMVAALEQGKRPAIDLAQMSEIGDQCSEREENAERAERQLIKLKLLNFFANKIGEELDAFITGINVRGFYAQGTELPVEGLVPIKSLPDDIYDFIQESNMLIGRRSSGSFRLGDSVKVVVAKVDLENRELFFELGGSKRGITRSIGREVKKGPTESIKRHGKPWERKSGNISAKHKTPKAKPKGKKGKKGKGKK